MADMIFNTKKLQIDKANTMMVAVLAGVSALSIFSIIATKTLISQANYLTRVNSEKEKAVKQLKANDQIISSLADSYKTFANQNPNALGGSATGTGVKDGDNAKLVLDALPSKYDFPALTASLEKLLTGYKITSLSGTDQAITQQNNDSTTPIPIEIPFGVSVEANYDGLKNLISNIEHSIRPFQVLTIDLSGNTTSMKAIIQAKTFYQPAKDLTIKTKVVK